MILFLSKLVPAFLYPLGLAVVLALVSLIVGSRRWPSRILVLLAVILLWLPSMPVTANLLALRWEAMYPEVAVKDLPWADAIVLLGGFAEQPLPPRVEPDLKDGVDRLFEAAQLFHAGKAAHIVVSAGNLPWHRIIAPEAHWIGQFLGELGVPADAIILESKSRNTHENAAFTAPILAAHGWHTVLLVTSADHMPRAMAIFRKTGIAATAATTDVYGHEPVFESILDVLPDVRALEETSNVLKEMIGLVYYRLRGWA